MADKCTIEFKIVDGTKPSGPKTPSTQETIRNLVWLFLILGFLGMLDNVLWAIQDFASVFNGPVGY